MAFSGGVSVDPATPIKSAVADGDSNRRLELTVNAAFDLGKVRLRNSLAGGRCTVNIVTASVGTRVSPRAARLLEDVRTAPQTLGVRFEVAAEELGYTAILKTDVQD